MKKLSASDLETLVDIDAVGELDQCDVAGWKIALGPYPMGDAWMGSVCGAET